MDSPKMIAGVDLIRRTGAVSFRVGYSDPDDGEPIVWYACAIYSSSLAQAGAALDPEGAVLKLCETVIDGGKCTHCDKVTVFEENVEEVAFWDLVIPSTFCVYAWDPELKVFRRGCE